MSSKLNPPTEAELDWLDNFLMQRIDEELAVEGKDEGIFDLSTLDGFFTAVVSGPDMIPPSRWLPSLWGDFEPEWQSQQEAEKVLSLLMRYMNSVAAFLMKDPKNFEPMFMERESKGQTYMIVDEWCEGYMRGVNLIGERWQMDSAVMSKLLAPIKAFTLEFEAENFDQLSDQEIEKLQKAVTPNVIAIHDYWLRQRSIQQPPFKAFRHTEPPAGRNDPCPCGSGKKYKKCCLH